MPVVFNIHHIRKSSNGWLPCYYRKELLSLAVCCRTIDIVRVVANQALYLIVRLVGLHCTVYCTTKWFKNGNAWLW